MVLRFIALFTIASMLFTLLSWGQNAPAPFWGRAETDTAGLAMHMMKHALLGAMVALPSRRVDYVLVGALAAVMIDVDHLGWLGLPTVSRASHSVGFVVLIVAVSAFLAGRGMLGGKASPVILPVVAGAAVAAHVGLDILDAWAYFPIWAPFTFRMIQLSEMWAVLLLGLGTLAVAASSVTETIIKSKVKYPSPEKSTS